MRYNVAFEIPGACCPGTLAIEIDAESEDDAVEKGRKYVGARAKLKGVKLKDVDEPDQSTGNFPQ